jgi:hypothetical protein
MKQTIDYYQFRNAFERCNRTSNFSHDGLSALFDHLEEIEDGTGEEMELDVIAICCDYSEHESALVAAMEQGFKPDTHEDDADTAEKAALEYLRDNTQVIEVDGGAVIIQGF